VCGLGASGRNGGWVNGWEDAFPSLVGRFHADGARWLVERSADSVREIERTVTEGDLDCDFSLKSRLVIALSEAQMARMDEDAAGRQRHGTADLVTILDADEAKAACGSPRALGGVLLKTAGAVQPALLVQGLRRLAL